MIGSWDMSHEIGIEMIDSQHRQLHKLLDELTDELKSYEEVLRMFEDVVEFTIEHFLQEEDTYGSSRISSRGYSGDG